MDTKIHFSTEIQSAIPKCNTKKWHHISRDFLEIIIHFLINENILSINNLRNSTDTLKERNFPCVSTSLSCKYVIIYSIDPNFPVIICWFKVSSGNTRILREISSKLKIKNPNNIMDAVQVSLLLTLTRFNTLLWCFHCCFEQVNTN